MKTQMNTAGGAPGIAAGSARPVFLTSDGTGLALTPAPGPFFAPIPIPQDTYTPLEFAAATLAIASAATIGANMVDVQNNTMTGTKAVVNGIAKGAAATVILSLTPKKTVWEIALTAAALAGAGYAIDRAMKPKPHAGKDGAP